MSVAAHSWKRLDGVDALRGLAILFVLLNHIHMRLLLAHIPYTRGLPDQLVSSLVWNGQRGVQIFFVVSGFLITSTSLRRWGTPSQVGVRDFYRLRFARIAPLLFLLLIVLSTLHLAQVRHFVVSEDTGGLGRALFAALTFHVNVLEARRGYLPGNWDILWSLSVEEMFYLFFPLVARFLGRAKFFIPVLCAFVLLGPFARTVLAHGSEIWREYSYLGGMDAIALGCLTALLVPRIHFSRARLFAVGGAGVAILIACLCFSLQLDGWGLERSGLDMTILALGTCLVIIASAESGWRAPRVFTPLLRLGQRSYEVYLTHMFVVFALFALFTSVWSTSVGSGGLERPIYAVPLLFVLVIASAAVLGSLVARFYSEPMNRFLRRRFGSAGSDLGSLVGAGSVETKIDENAKPDIVRSEAEAATGRMD
ncbi:MAG TPA: acyltransferase [Terriglobales bacterium]|nr:acyltransferase [Terriglobales bacterium]